MNRIKTEKRDAIHTIELTQKEVKFIKNLIGSVLHENWVGVFPINKLYEDFLDLVELGDGNA